MARNDVPVEVLRHVTVFAGIDQEKLLRLCDRCRLVTFKAGETVIAEGATSSEIYIILKGKLKIVLNAQREPLEILELRPGHCVGEASVIGVQSHSASVIATEDAELLELGRQLLMDLAETEKDLFSIIILNIARELARRLYNTDKILLKMAQEREHPQA
jgi:CRP/FNR family transcriptional regulator, cyclic AMP receptor protein